MNLFETLDPEKVIATLSPHVTAERYQKIQDIAGRRIPNVSVVLEDIYDRGNVSAVMRSAEAFGFHKFHVIQLSEKFKESQRVTQGAHKWLQTRKWASTAECVTHLKQQGYRVAVTHLDPKAMPLEQLDVSTPVALCFGNEKDGASKELLELADQTVFIPMRGFVQSFNISVAAAICFYSLQARLQGVRGSPEEIRQLTAYYLTRSVDQWEHYFDNPFRT